MGYFLCLGYDAQLSYDCVCDCMCLIFTLIFFSLAPCFLLAKLGLSDFQIFTLAQVLHYIRPMLGNEKKKIKTTVMNIYIHNEISPCVLRNETNEMNLLMPCTKLVFCLVIICLNSSTVFVDFSFFFRERCNWLFNRIVKPFRNKMFIKVTVTILRKKSNRKVRKVSNIELKKKPRPRPFVQIIKWTTKL